MLSRWEAGRALAAQLQEAALLAADPAHAVAQHLQRDGPILTVGERRYDLDAAARLFLLSVGKASLRMTAALLTCLGPWGEKLVSGLIVLPDALLSAAHAWRPAGVPLRFIGAGHPLPTADSVLAGQAAVALLRQAQG